MFHAPTTEAKQQNDPSRSQAMPELRRELSPLVPVSAGHAWSGAAGGGAAPCANNGIRQPFTALHSAFGNQAILRMLSRSPSSIQTKLPMLARQVADDEQITSPTDAGVPAGGSTPAGPGASGRPVFFCSKSVFGPWRHAFFRVGGSGAGNPTFELEHDEQGDHCPCGIQGWPTRDYPEDRDTTEAQCIAAPTISESCLQNNWSKYPLGKYCARGPNSNTYARVLAERCGGSGLRPPGNVPGFDDSPPAAGTANPALDARATILPGGCGTIECSDRWCHEIYF